ncbi:MAG: hypothetical protein QM756_33335 [Polyangiaceae bacterium]
MFVSSGAGASGNGSAAPSVPTGSRRRVVVRCCILAALVVAYRVAIGPLHGLIGNPTFLMGLFICITAAAWLGLRGALLVIVAVATIDRWLALQLTVTSETGLTAGIIALLVKLVLAGGSAWWWTRAGVRSP